MIKNRLIKYALTGIKTDDKIIANIERIYNADVQVIEKMKKLLECIS